jgi:hypothetical protein
MYFSRAAPEIGRVFATSSLSGSKKVAALNNYHTNAAAAHECLLLYAWK